MATMDIAALILFRPLFFDVAIAGKVYRVRQQNSLLEIEKRAALGSTSQCSPVLPSYPFPVGHSIAELCSILLCHIMKI